jgi:hypothetical protein
MGTMVRPRRKALWFSFFAAIVQSEIMAEMLPPCVLLVNCAYKLVAGTPGPDTLSRVYIGEDFKEQAGRCFCCDVSIATVQNVKKLPKEHVGEDGDYTFGIGFCSRRCTLPFATSWKHSGFEKLKAADKLDQYRLYYTKNRQARIILDSRQQHVRLKERAEFSSMPQGEPMFAVHDQNAIQCRLFSQDEPAVSICGKALTGEKRTVSVLSLKDIVPEAIAVSSDDKEGPSSKRVRARGVHSVLSPMPKSVHVEDHVVFVDLHGHACNERHVLVTHVQPQVRSSELMRCYVQGQSGNGKEGSTIFGHKNRLLVKFHVEKTVASIVECYVHKGADSNPEFKSMLQHLAPHGQVGIIGISAVVPYCTQHNGGKVSEQTRHNDADKPNQLVVLAINTIMSEHLRTVFFGPGEQKRSANTGSYAFDPHFDHAGPSTEPSAKMVQEATKDGTWPIFLPSRVFVTLVNGDLSQESISLLQFKEGLNETGMLASIFSLRK